MLFWNKYCIKDEDNAFWCKSKMKPVDAEDIPKNYRKFGYWSDYDSSKKYITNGYFLIIFEYLAMKLSGIKCKLVKFDHNI